MVTDDLTRRHRSVRRRGIRRPLWWLNKLALGVDAALIAALLTGAVLPAGLLGTMVATVTAIDLYLAHFLAKR